MATQYTAQAGDTANSIAAAHGFSNYQTAGISTPASGNYDKIAAGETLTIGNAKSGNASAIPTTPIVVSSKDSATGFTNNTSSLNTKTATNNVLTAKDASGNTLYYTVDPSGKVVYQNAPGGTASTVAGGGAKPNPTDLEKGAAAGAGTGAEPNITTGNPILDSLQSWEQTKDAQAQADALTQKQQIQTMLSTNLAANDATFAAQIAGIQNTYSGLIDTQTRINSLNVDRTKAYGLATGGALSTPLEYTDAVSEKEQAAADAIAKLDNQRDTLIGQAKAAQVSGDAKLLQDSMDSIDKVETDMKNTLAQIASEVTNRATLLNTVETQQKADQAAQSAKLLAAAAAQFGTQYAGLTDPKQQDQMIKNIVAQSGGMLDYGTVYAGLEKAKADAAATKTQAEKDAASIAKDKASANSSNASAAVDWAKAANGGNTPTASQSFFTKTDKLLTMTDASGNAYTDKNGYITPSGFKQLVQAAGEGGVTKTQLLQQYGGQLFPGDKNDYAGYGLTGADVKTLTGIVTYIPPTGTGN